MLTLDRLRELLDYDPCTGVFTRKVAINKYPANAPAGGPNMKGYWSVTVDGRRYLAHVLAWFFMVGEWPPHEVDHRDGDGLNNRWLNLRSATHKQNLENRKRAGCGVTWDAKRGKWVAQIKHQYRRVFLGRFQDKQDAIAARQTAERALFTHSRACR